MGLIGLLLSVHAVALAGGCEGVATLVDVEGAVGAARVAYAAHDDVALASAVVGSRAALHCIVEPVEPELASAVHFVHGLWVAVERGEQAAVPYLAAARVDGAGLGVDLTDAERALVGRLGDALDTWRPTPGAVVGPPLVGRIAVDGAPHPPRLPGDSPVVVQHLGPGAVVFTEYLRPGEAPPRYVRRRPAVLAASGTLVVVTGGLLAGAAFARADLYAARGRPLSDDEVASIVSRNHAFLVAGGVTGAIATVGLGAVALSYVW